MILLPAAFMVALILVFGLLSSNKLQSNNVPWTLKTRSFELPAIIGDPGITKVSSHLTWFDTSSLTPTASIFSMAWWVFRGDVSTMLFWIAAAVGVAYTHLSSL
jgi:hypothetical protein